MSATRAGLWITLIIVGWMAGCQQPAPPPEEGPAPDPKLMAEKAHHLKMVASGKNTELSYKATEYGQLYVVDQDNGLYVYTGPLGAGERFVFAPASSRATIDKQTIDLIRGTNENDEYRIYFLPQ